MNKRLTGDRHHVTLAAALVLWSTFASAADFGPTVTLVAESGQNVCTTGQPINLCVSEGRFAPDTYSLVEAGKVVVTAIDDETDRGVGADTGRGLQCTARVSQDSKSHIRVETGRLCIVSLNGKAILRVQVNFR